MYFDMLSADYVELFSRALCNDVNTPCAKVAILIGKMTQSISGLKKVSESERNHRNLDIDVLYEI